MIPLNLHNEQLMEQMYHVIVDENDHLIMNLKEK
jgi:hypothetical protein